MNSIQKSELKAIALKIRNDIIEQVHSAKSGHPGGSLSIADIITYLYFKEMEIDPKNPKYLKVIWGIGYKVDVLLTEIGKLLFGNGELLPTVLIGAGRLGTAVSSFISRDTNGYKLIAAFDINPALEGKEISGVTIRPLSELESFCAAHKPVVAVLCVPRQSAMDLSDELVRLGIQGFWNFSHYDLSVVYPQVTVENVHLGDSLMSLGYRLRNHDE